VLASDCPLTRTISFWYGLMLSGFDPTSSLIGRSHLVRKGLGAEERPGLSSEITRYATGGSAKESHSKKIGEALDPTVTSRADQTQGDTA
jgi:hypothetical protein